MTVEIQIQDPNGVEITTLELFDDVYRHMQTVAALEGIPVETYIIRIVTNHARDIIDAAKEIK